MKSVVFYALCFSFVGGVALRSFFSIDFHASLLLLILGFALLCIAFRNGRHEHAQLLLIGLSLSATWLGILRLEIPERFISPLSNHTEETGTFFGTVSREPELRTASLHLYVELENYEERILVIADPYADLEYGDRVRITGILKLPESFETDLGRTFNYPGYLRARGVRFMIPYAEVTLEERGRRTDIRAHLFAVKARFMESVEKVIPEPQAGLGEGVLLGVKRALGEELEEAFRLTGIIHIVVLSGYNVMLVAEAIMRLLSRFFFPRTRLILGIAAISTFAVLVGLSATVVRASIMAILVLIARATGHTYAILRALMFAGIVMLLINPYLLVYDPGFQLSFLATLGLIFLAPIIDARFMRVPSSLGVREFLTATIATQVFVSPLLLYSIGSFSVVAILVNVLVLPMVPIAMLLTFGAGMLGLISWQIGMVVGFFAHLSLLYIVKVAEFFSLLPFASFSVPPFSFAIVIALYLVMGYGIFRFAYHKKASPTESVKIDAEPYDLSEWTIVEVETEPPAAQSAAGGSRTVLPFR